MLLFLFGCVSMILKGDKVRKIAILSNNLAISPIDKINKMFYNGFRKAGVRYE